jgi:hypothetical protein
MLSAEEAHMQSRLEDLALLFFEYVSFPFEHIHLNNNFVNVNETLLLITLENMLYHLIM